ncbi:hypothetical protein H263_06577 [Brachyspira hampsonii 30599]|nr:hypothetical protein H263_06577 [Brachyspira hampsonii 30599]
MLYQIYIIASFKKIVKCKNGGYLVIINEKDKDSNIFIPDLISNKEAINK